jgi:predicted molibdopterin-dependent oxidoreductase YjgC
MHVIYKNGWHHSSFVEERTEGFEEFLAMIEQFPPERASDISGISVDEMVKVADWYANSEKSTIVYVLGITQHTTGVDNVKSLCNMALLCGQIGRPSTGVNPLRGQNNVQGACDMGALPNVFPGYQAVTNPDLVKKFEAAWGAQMSPEVGLTLMDYIYGLQDGSIKGVVVFGANPVVSFPDANMVEEALSKAEFLLAIDIFPTPTTRLAHVVLPAASFAESDGTFTCSERRVQRVREAIEPLAGKTNWEIIQEVSSLAGCPMHYNSAEEIFDEIASLAPSYGGMSYPRLDAEMGLCWPCPAPDHPGTKFLHKDQFVRGKGLFAAIDYRPPAEEPDEDFPFWLTTGAVYTHYCTGTMTRRCSVLSGAIPEPFVSIHPEDAGRLGIRADDRVEVTSRRGNIELKAQVIREVRPGSLFIPYHFMEGSANRLTVPDLDPVSKTPEYKVCAVRLKKSA